MTKNVGGIDKILRIVIGLAAIAFALVGPETGYNAWGFLGIVPLATALLGGCPPYAMLGINTCSVKNEG
jgi:Na+/proline symporter